MSRILLSSVAAAAVLASTAQASAQTEIQWWHAMGGNLGDALAPLAVGGLLSVLSWREIVMVNLAPGVVVAVLILAFLGTWNLVAPEEAGKPRKAHTFRSDAGLRPRFSRYRRKRAW